MVGMVPSIGVSCADGASDVTWTMTFADESAHAGFLRSLRLVSCRLSTLGERDMAAGLVRLADGVLAEADVGDVVRVRLRDEDYRDFVERLLHAAMLSEFF